MRQSLSGRLFTKIATIIPLSVFIIFAMWFSASPIKIWRLSYHLNLGWPCICFDKTGQNWHDASSDHGTHKALHSFKCSPQTLPSHHVNKPVLTCWRPKDHLIQRRVIPGKANMVQPDLNWLSSWLQTQESAQITPEKPPTFPILNCQSTDLWTK